MAKLKLYSVNALPTTGKDVNGIYQLKTASGYKQYRVSADGSWVELDAPSLQAVTAAGNATTRRIVQTDAHILKISTNQAAPGNSPSTRIATYPTEWSSWSSGTGFLYLSLPAGGVANAYYRIRGTICSFFNSSGTQQDAIDFDISIFGATMGAVTPVYLSSRVLDWKVLPLRLIYSGTDVRVVFGNSMIHYGTRLVVESIYGRVNNLAEESVITSGLMASLSGYSTLEFPPACYLEIQNKDVVVVSSNHTVAANTESLLFTNASNINLNLPDPALNKGRKLFLRSKFVSGIVISLNYSVTDVMSGLAANNLPMDDYMLRGTLIQSTGTQWVFVGEFY